MSETRRKIRYHQVNGSADDKKASSLNSALASLLLIFSVIGCSSVKKSKTAYESSLCTKGEGSLKVISPKFKEIIQVSFRKSSDRWLLGAEIPLRGEEVFIVGRKGALSKNLSGLLKRAGISSQNAYDVARRIFPVDRKFRSDFNQVLPGGFDVQGVFDVTSHGNFKLFLMREYIFIKKTYAEAEFRVLECSRQEKFQILKI